VLERLAAEGRARETVLLVTSDAAVRERVVRRCESAAPQRFSASSRPCPHREDAPSRLADRVDPETRARLERLRRGEG
jgi:hypothetical protein